MSPQENDDRICELKGNLIALDAVLVGLVRAMPPEQRSQCTSSVRVSTEVARTVLLHSPISEHCVEGFEHDVSRWMRLLESTLSEAGAAPIPAVVRR